MAELNAHVGDEADVVIEMTDKDGNVTDDWDAAGGVNWTNSHPASLELVDDDAEPRDAKLRFTALTPAGEEAFLDADFDGRVGPDEERVRLRSVSMAVVAGAATGGRLQVTMRPVPPEA